MTNRHRLPSQFRIAEDALDELSVPSLHREQALKHMIAGFARKQEEALLGALGVTTNTATAAGSTLTVDVLLEVLKKLNLHRVRPVLGPLYLEPPEIDFTGELRALRFLQHWNLVPARPMQHLFSAPDPIPMRWPRLPFDGKMRKLHCVGILDGVGYWSDPDLPEDKIRAVYPDGRCEIAAASLWEIDKL